MTSTTETAEDHVHRSAPPFDTAEIDRLLTTTRSVRRRLDLSRPVGLDVVMECLQAAVHAPSAANTQLWRWLVVTDDGLKSELARLFRAGGRDYLRANAEQPGDEASQRVYRSAQHLVDVLDRVPVLLVPCIAAEVDQTNAPALYGSVFPALWSFMLALRARGLGSTYTTFHLAYAAEAAALLGIPPGVTQVGLVPVAYTVGTDFRPARRRPAAEVTYLDRWGAPVPATAAR
ncbi:nitroreductase family protein [Geodermatophilus sp. SYSU D00742]